MLKHIILPVVPESNWFQAKFLIKSEMKKSENFLKFIYSNNSSITTALEVSMCILNPLLTKFSRNV